MPEIFRFCLLFSIFLPLGIDKRDLAAIREGAHREVQPDGSVAVSLYQQLIEVLFRFVSVIQQDCRIANQLLHTQHADINCAARKVVASSHTTYLFIKLRTAITRVNSDRLLAHSILIIISLAQYLQPFANSLQICDRLMGRDVIHFRMTIASCHLPKHEMLGEFCLIVVKVVMVTMVKMDFGNAVIAHYI